MTEHLRQLHAALSADGRRLEGVCPSLPHPSRLSRYFERLSIAEKREVLKTFSLAIRGLLHDEVDPRRPGLISYDHYWDVLRENPSLRTLPGVSEVVQKSNVLEGRIKHAYTRPNIRTWPCVSFTASASTA